MNKKVLSLWIVAMFLVSLGAMPVLQGGYVKAQSLIGARIIVEVRSENGKPVLEYRKDNTILVKVLDQYGNPIKGLEVLGELYFMRTHNTPFMTIPLQWDSAKNTYVGSIDLRYIGWVGWYYLRIKVNGNIVYSDYVLVYKQGLRLPIPPKGWKVSPSTPVNIPYVIVDGKKYYPHEMLSETGETWLILDENGNIPDIETYKKAAKTATAAWIANSYKQVFLTDILDKSSLGAIVYQLSKTTTALSVIRDFLGKLLDVLSLIHALERASAAAWKASFQIRYQLVETPRVIFHFWMSPLDKK